jgi:hypothetical protein
MISILRYFKLFSLHSLKNKIMTLLKQDEFSNPLKSLIYGVGKMKKMQVKYGNNTTFYPVRSIHLTCKVPYIILDDANDTRIDLNKIVESKFI